MAIDEDDPAIILFTSGTTGRPKGATLSHRNLLHFGQTSFLRIAIGAALSPAGAPSPDVQPSSLCVSPFFHVSGMVALLGQPWSGAKVVFPRPGRWSEEVHLRLTEEHRLTSWSGVPTQFWRLLQYPDLDRFDLSNLRSVGGGGATFQPELIRQLTDRFPGISIGVGYGMSESTGMGLGTGGPLLAAFPNSVGVPNPTSEVEIRRPDGTKAPDGEVGEICLRHASIFLGYWNDEAATKEVLDADRWYRTGDYGRIVDGLVYLESRLRDLIIRGGENIYPIEIENRLVEHPDVDDAAVIGVDHPTLGQEVLAVVVMRTARRSPHGRSRTGYAPAWRRSRCRPTSPSCPTCRTRRAASCRSGCSKTAPTSSLPAVSSRATEGRTEGRRGVTEMASPRLSRDAKARPIAA